MGSKAKNFFPARESQEAEDASFFFKFISVFILWIFFQDCCITVRTSLEPILAKLEYMLNAGFMTSNIMKFEIFKICYEN